MEEGNYPPKWLRNEEGVINHRRLCNFTMNMLKLDIKDLLEDSCFYISSGADITPMVAFQDFIYSYVFCDLDLWSPLRGIRNKFFGMLIKVKDRLYREGFREVQKFTLNRHFLGIGTRQNASRNGSCESRFKNCEISFWRKNQRLYSLIYLQNDNTEAYIDLYLKNGILPKALCAIAPDGGFRTVEHYCGRVRSLTVKQMKEILPEYLLGHTYCVGDYNRYKEVITDVDYFGDYLYSVDDSGRRIKPTRGTVDFLKILKRSDLDESSE